MSLGELRLRARVMYNAKVIRREACGPRRRCSIRLQGGLTLVLLASSCLPLEDLSAYKTAAASAREASSSGVGNGTVGPGLPGRPPEASAPRAGMGEAFPGGSTALAPAVGVSRPSSGPCSGDCPGCNAADAAGTQVVGHTDASAPLPDAVEDAGVNGCDMDERRGPNGNCYLAVLPPLSWPTARASCQARGAGWDLATLRSDADNDFASALLPQREIWVGGADLVDEGTWVWVTDGAEFWVGEGLSGIALNGAYNNWFLDEPNGSDTSDCLRVLIDARWADSECTAIRSSVCEGPAR
jgi:Lectin C-type domain